MITQQTDLSGSFGHLDLPAKRQYLSVLSDVVWDIETELAQVKARRAALMSSLQADLQDSHRLTGRARPTVAVGREPR